MVIRDDNMFTTAKKGLSTFTQTVVTNQKQKRIYSFQCNQGKFIDINLYPALSPIGGNHPKKFYVIVCLKSSHDESSPFDKLRQHFATHDSLAVQMAPISGVFIADEPESCILVIQYPKKEFIKKYISLRLEYVIGRPITTYTMSTKAARSAEI